MGSDRAVRDKFAGDSHEKTKLRRMRERTELQAWRWVRMNEEEQKLRDRPHEAFSKERPMTLKRLFFREKAV